MTIWIGSCYFKWFTDRLDHSPHWFLLNYAKFSIDQILANCCMLWLSSLTNSDDYSVFSLAASLVELWLLSSVLDVSKYEGSCYTYMPHVMLWEDRRHGSRPVILDWIRWLARSVSCVARAPCGRKKPTD